MREHCRVYVFVWHDGVRDASDAQRRRLPAPCPVRVGVSCDADPFGLGTGAGLVHGAVRWRAYDARSFHGLGIGHSLFAVSHSGVPLILWHFCTVHTCPVSFIRAGLLFVKNNFKIKASWRLSAGSSYLVFNSPKIYGIKNAPYICAATPQMLSKGRFQCIFAL